MPKALLCTSFGPPETLVVTDQAAAPLGPGQIRMRVRAAGVNFPDTLMIANKYQFKPPLPFAPGGECAGTVLEVAPGVDRFAPGDRVIALPGWGAFAEDLVVDAAQVSRTPAGMDDITAAAFVFTYGTTYHALVQRAQLRPGETLLVLGAAGGVGLAAVELGKALGARVIAAASSPAKLAVARDHGADAVIDYGADDLRQALKALCPAGPDVIYDPVGGAYSEAALRSIAWNGRFLVVGFAAGSIPSVPLNLALLKGCAIVGVFWGAFTAREPGLAQANLDALAALHQAGRIRPHVSATYPLAAGGAALRALIDRQATGKLVITMA